MKGWIGRWLDKTFENVFITSLLTIDLVLGVDVVGDTTRCGKMGFRPRLPLGTFIPCVRDWSSLSFFRRFLNHSWTYINSLWNIWHIYIYILEFRVGNNSAHLSTKISLRSTTFWYDNACYLNYGEHWWQLLTKYCRLISHPAGVAIDIILWVCDNNARYTIPCAISRKRNKGNLNLNQLISKRKGQATRKKPLQQGPTILQMKKSIKEDKS